MPSVRFRLVYPIQESGMADEWLSSLFHMSSSPKNSRKEEIRKSGGRDPIRGSPGMVKSESRNNIKEEGIAPWANNAYNKGTRGPPSARNFEDATSTSFISTTP